MNPWLWLRCAVILAACAATDPPTYLPPPSAAGHPVAYDEYVGLRVADPYRWLEDGEDPAVKAWTAAQNARTRAYLDSRPERAALAEALERLADSASTSDVGVKAAGERLFALSRFPSRQQPALTTLALSGDPATRRIVLDVSKLSAAGDVAIDWFVPTLDGSKVAVSLSSGGSEIGTLHVYDVATGGEVEAQIADVQRPAGGGSLAWSADGTGFWYTRYRGSAAPPAQRDFNQQVFYHVIGSDSRADRPVLTATDGIPPTAEIFLSNPQGAKAALASVQKGDGGAWQHFLLSASTARRIAGYDEKIKTAVLTRDGAVFGISVRGSANGEIVRIAPEAPAPTVVVPVGRDVLLSQQIAISGNRLFVIVADGGPNHIESYRFDGTDRQGIGTPPVSSVSDLQPMPGGKLLYRVQRYTAPSQTMLWSAATGQSVTTLLSEMTPMDFSPFEASRFFAISKDGSRIPITLIARRDLQRNGRTPLMLYGYGGFGLGEAPELLSPSVYLWLRSGGAYAIANIRGGDEYGDAWHTAGMLTHKQTVFDDFFAAASYLKAQRITSTARLALRGGSNGGLLVGATLTQHPDVAHAIVATVGIYDMLRLEQAPNGVFVASEYGSIRNHEQFRALYAYSPLQHVKPGIRYPAIFLATGANDGRVDPFQSRKFAAALQQADPQALVLLRTSANAGHGIASSRDERIALQADYLTFLFAQFQLHLPDK